MTEELKKYYLEQLRLRRGCYRDSFRSFSAFTCNINVEFYYDGKDIGKMRLVRACGVNADKVNICIIDPSFGVYGNPKFFHRFIINDDHLTNLRWVGSSCK
ncbi:MAG: hypothetical protein OEL54_04240 [Flavobacteriaceae bacterium]|nr:hypothetical protein [Flavobacteriaceae bacterium]